MDRVYESGAAATPPSPPASPSFGYPTGGNPSTATAATKPGPYLFYQLVEEIREVITSAGLTPDHADLTQLRQAIQSMIVGANKAVVVDGASFEASVANGEVVRWDSANTRYDEAVADGTANNLAVGIADVTNGKVYLYGECPLFVGLTPGARYYLDATTPGAITTIAPADAVPVGIAKSATILFVDIDSGVLPDASETVKGVMEIATDAEAQAFTANKAIDGAKLNSALKGSNQNLAGNGYQKLPGGLILQWGSTASITAQSNVVVTMPIAFPNGAIRGYTCVQNFASDVNAIYTPYVRDLNTTQITLRNTHSAALSLFWFALGY